jgi:VanZ family protein
MSYINVDNSRREFTRGLEPRLVSKQSNVFRLNCSAEGLKFSEKIRFSGRRSLKFALLTAIVIALIIYGSLYPFEFRVPIEGAGALDTLLGSWSAIPGRTDFVANILFYMPLGYSGVLLLRNQHRFELCLLLVAVGGTGLSVTMELAQYFDVGRVTSATDVYANALGTVIGGVGALCFFEGWGFPLLEEAAARPIPAALIAAWIGYRLYPYVPTADFHKYWNALKPLVHNPNLSLYDVYRNTVIWLTIFSLIESITAKYFWLFIFVAGVFVGRVLIVDAVLTPGEVVGASVAFCLWPIVDRLPSERRSLILILLLGSAVVVERLQPFDFQFPARSFGWLPFRSLMLGSLGTDVMSFFEKSFFYGSLIFLAVEAGWSLRLAAIIVAGSLAATSWAETYLPGRSAEITDAVLALLLAVGMALAKDRPRQQ